MGIENEEKSCDGLFRKISAATVHYVHKRSPKDIKLLG